MSMTALSPEELTKLTADLNRLARNIWWTWNQGAQEIFQELSPRCWQNLYHNAVAVLHEVSDYELRVRLQDTEFARRVRQVLDDFDAYMQDKETWGRQNAPALLEHPVAYFSAEFGFHETLPIAAGGLGILAGDHAKSASDLDIGFVGHQPLLPRRLFPAADQPGQLADGILHAAQPGEPAAGTGARRQGRAAGVRGGNRVDGGLFPGSGASTSGAAAVYLLDSNRPENPQHHRDLTRRVYGGDNTMRIMQEVLLGVGGVRLLRSPGRATLGLPHERRPRRLSDAGIDPGKTGGRASPLPTPWPRPGSSASSPPTPRSRRATTASAAT